MHRITLQFAAVVAAGLLASGCGDSTDEPAEAPATGTLHAALAFAGTTHDVVSMGYRVIDPDLDCADPDAGPIADAVVGLEDEALPAWLTAAGANHAFADALFVLQPGLYKVCVTPLQADGTPSEVCGPTEDVFEVFAEQTTEGVIFSQCEGDPSGGLDVIAALNNPPHIDDLDIAASKFITTCESATITVTASDPDGDDLNYAFEITGAPAGANPQLASAGNQARFSSDVAGPYEITVTVDDGLGGEARLSFPIHVSAEDCAPPCIEQCVRVADRVVEACLEVIGQFIPQGGEEFCALAGEISLDNCDARFCEQEPGDCRETCQGVADGTRESCFEVSPDPIICEGGAGLVFDTCVEEFQCPPPPLPCDQQCFADAQATLDACLADGAGQLICPDAADPNLQTCFVRAQAQLDACAFGPDGCAPPEQRDCQQECGAAASAEALACAGEPECRDAGACNIDAQQNAQFCQQQCCVDDCFENQCVPQCDGDQECLQECARNQCQPQCFPEPPCEEACGNAANQIIADCLDNRPPEPICPDSPDNDCLARGYDAFAACLEGQCGGDACGVRCVQSCIEDCNDIDACQQDPALTAECQQACQPPPPPCEEACQVEFEACLDAGVDPLECERGVDACLFFCQEPPCEEVCGFELRRCIDAGIDPAECQQAFDDCLQGCEPPPSENDDPSCSDGVDNDGDGFVDCDDFDCTFSPDVTVCGDLENTDALCSDGIDNDANGFIDCDDFACSRNPNVTVCNDPQDCALACEQEAEACFGAGLPPDLCDAEFQRCLDACP